MVEFENITRTLNKIMQITFALFISIINITAHNIMYSTIKMLD
jgi:hypothetical protein